MNGNEQMLQRSWEGLSCSSSLWQCRRPVLLSISHYLQLVPSLTRERTIEVDCQHIWETERMATQRD